jgi:hypothetical protein
MAGGHATADGGAAAGDATGGDATIEDAATATGSAR